MARKQKPLTEADFDAAFEALDLKPIPSGYTIRRLPTVTRDRALRGKMNGDIRELAGATMPRSARQRANAPRSKVTGITAGSNIHGAAYDDGPVHNVLTPSPTTAPKTVSTLTDDRRTPNTPTYSTSTPNHKEA